MLVFLFGSIAWSFFIW